MNLKKGCARGRRRRGGGGDDEPLFGIYKGIEKQVSEEGRRGWHVHAGKRQRKEPKNPKKREKEKKRNRKKHTL